MRVVPGFVVCVLGVVSGVSAQTHVIRFEEPGIVAMGNSPGAAVPATARIADQFLATEGVSFRSTGGFVAAVVHGGATPSPPNIIGGTSATGRLNYFSPITIRFFDPADPTQPGVTDFVRVRADLSPLGSGTVTMDAYTVDGVLLGSTTVPDVAPGAVLTLAFSAPGIHAVVVSETSGTVGWDNVEFTPPRRAATYLPYGVACAGALGGPQLRGVPGALPVSGATVAATVTAVPAVGVMIVGFSDVRFGGVTLPWDLAPLGAPGCTLLTDIQVTMPMTTVGTTAGWSLSIPSTSTLAGRRFFTQAAVLDPTANALGLVFSNACAGTIGG